MGSLEDRLRREQQIVWPDYGGGSIVNLAAWVLRHFGGGPVWPVLSTPGFPHALADRAESVVILLVDGLGYLQLQRSLRDGAMPSLARLLDRPQGFHGSITSVFPSTTPAAFLALNTGRTPAELGVLADNRWEPRAQAIVNTLTWRTRYGGTSVFGVAEPDVGPTIYEAMSCMRSCWTGSGTRWKSPPLQRSAGLDCLEERSSASRTRSGTSWCTLDTQEASGTIPVSPTAGSTISAASTAD